MKQVENRINQLIQELRTTVTGEFEHDFRNPEKVAAEFKADPYTEMGYVWGLDWTPKNNHMYLSIGRHKEDNEQEFIQAVMAHEFEFMGLLKLAVNKVYTEDTKFTPCSWNYTQEFIGSQDGLESIEFETSINGHLEE